MTFMVRGLATLVNLLSIRGYFKKIKYFEVYLFAPMISWLVYAAMFEKSIFPPGIDKPFTSLINPSPREKVLYISLFDKQGKVWFPSIKGDALNI